MGGNEVRFVHLADTHLGYSAYRKIDSDGINLREKDIYKAFIAAIDYILEKKPDFVIHTGDLFDSVRPTNRAITIALEQLLRLSKARIPTIIIAGNHETPKLKETGHIFRLFEHLDYIYPVYRGAEKIDLEVDGKKISIHAIPHCREKEDFSESLKSAAPDSSSDYNILVTHGAIQAIQVFKMNEFNEYIIPISLISKGFDYVALGHYHGFTRIKNNIVYSGSTERMSFSESKEQKGIVDVRISSSTITDFVPLPTRNMIEIGPIDCKDLKPREIIERIKEKIGNRDFRDSIVRLSLTNVDPAIYKSIDFSSINNIFSRAMHFEIRHSIGKEPEQIVPTDIMIADLLTEFEKFLRRGDYKDKDILLEIGKRYIRQAEGEE